jgi:hypothetical protein
MADKTPPDRPLTPSRPKRPPVTVTHQPRKREAAEDRRARQAATAIAAQADLKREAAERRERKNSSS